MSTIGFTLGIAGAAAAVIWLSMAPRSPQAPQASAARGSRFHFDLGNDLKSIRVLGQF